MLNHPDRRKDKKRAKAGDRRGGFWSMLIDPYRQVKLSVMVLMLNIVFGTILSLIVHHYFIEIYEVNINYLGNLEDFSEDQKNEIIEKYMLPFLVCLAIVLAFIFMTFVIIVRYTHQIYGPLVSIHNYMDSMLAGKNDAPLKIRSSDQLDSLAAKLSALSEKMRKDSCNDKDS